ncbi:MAG: carbohydrate ABC transporter permease [Myxococcota bacterium]
MSNPAPIEPHSSAVSSIVTGTRDVWLPFMCFVGPALFLLGGLLILPLLFSVGLSFYDTTILSLIDGTDRFLGIENYAVLLQDEDFWSAVLRLLLFAGVTTGLELALALTVAFYLDQVWTPPKLLEALLLLPMLVIPVVSGLLFRYLFDPGEGLWGTLFERVGLEAPALLGHPILAFVVMVLQDVWRMWPFMFMIVYAGLKSLPREPMEAARLDGCTNFQVFRFVLAPLLMPTVTVAVVLKLIESLRAFTEIYVMTGGGPGRSTELLSMYVVKVAFDYFQLGLGAAAGVLVFGFGMLIAGVLLTVQARRVREVP